jgi:hypothetical protein
MARTFIVSKHFMNFELHVDGKIEVKALPPDDHSKETITLLADVHQTFIEWQRIKNKEQDLVKLAVRYFEKKGFEIKEKDDSSTPPQNT